MQFPHMSADMWGILKSRAWSHEKKIRLAKANRMCYYSNGRSATNGRLTLLLGNYSVKLGEAFGTE